MSVRAFLDRLSRSADATAGRELAPARSLTTAEGRALEIIRTPEALAEFEIGLRRFPDDVETALEDLLRERDRA